MHETRLILQTGSYIIMHAVINSIGFLPLILSPSAPYFVDHFFCLSVALIQCVGIFYLFFFLFISRFPDPRSPSVGLDGLAHVNPFPCYLLFLIFYRCSHRSVLYPSIILPD